MSYIIFDKMIFSTVDANLDIKIASKAYKLFLLTAFITTKDPLNTFNTRLSLLNTYPFFSDSPRDIKFCFNLGIYLTSSSSLSVPSYRFIQLKVLIQLLRA